MSVAAIPSATMHAPYRFAPASPVRHGESDESCSDDGSVGPRDFVAPAVPVKKMPQQPQPLQEKQDIVPMSALYDDQVAAAKQAVEQYRTAAFPIDADDEKAVEALSHAMTYLPLEDLEAARHVSAAFRKAADRVAPKPLANDDIVFVRWEPQELRTAIAPAKPAKRGQTLPPVFPWRCLACGNISAGPRQCNHCRAPLASSACRVFMGQLRKDLSAELAVAVLRSVAPEITVLHMEGHTNGIDGRGKGCTWAYVNSVEDAMRLVALHKRVFVDKDADGNEGFWFIKHDDLKAHLAAFAEVIGATAGRPAMFPRQPLVAELPSKSMLAEYVRNNGGFMTPGAY